MTDPIAADPAPSPSPEPAREVSAPLTSFVRGGSITGAFEKQLAEQRADAEKRRDQEEARRKATLFDPNARMLTTRLGGTKSHASVVIMEHDSDQHAMHFVTCELSMDEQNPPDGLMLIMCCRFCALRFGQAQAQMTIRSKHRKFELDTRRQGELWVNPADPTDFVHLAGTIHLTEACACPMCSKRFVIDNSVLRWL